MRSPRTLTATVALVLSLGGATSVASAAPDPGDAPVCHAVVGAAPVPGIHMIAFAGVSCRQQPDALRWEGSLEFQREGSPVWFTADRDGLEKTYPLTQTLPLSAKCEQGYWRTTVEVWERTAGKPWHGVYHSGERIVHTSDCTEHIHPL